MIRPYSCDVEIDDKPEASRAAGRHSAARAGASGRPTWPFPFRLAFFSSLLGPASPRRRTERMGARMKRTLVGMAIVLALSAACRGDSGSDGKLTIAVIPKGTTHAFWQMI